VLDAADRGGEPPDAETIGALLDAGAGASCETVRLLAEAATACLGTDYSDEAEALFRVLPGVAAVAERALDEDEGARVAARLTAAVEADRRDVASGLRALITGAAAERRRLEAAREAAVEERRAAAAEREAAAQESRAAAAQREAAEERRAAAAAEREAAEQERRAAAAERAELLRLRAEVAALAGGGAAVAPEGGAGGGAGGEAGPLGKRARGG
jgi:colicin import membrane protein